MPPGVPREERNAVVLYFSTPDEDNILERFSIFTRLLRVTAYCYKFVYT